MAILRSALLSAALVLVVSLITAAGGSSARETRSSGSAPAFETPRFVEIGKQYAFTWSGGGPAQTYTVKRVLPDGWVLVDVAEETVNPAYLIPGDYPSRWLNVALAISIQEMRQLVR
jgi:hypothetical protein